LTAIRRRRETDLAYPLADFDTGTMLLFARHPACLSRAAGVGFCMSSPPNGPPTREIHLNMHRPVGTPVANDATPGRRWQRLVARTVSIRLLPDLVSYRLLPDLVSSRLLPDPVASRLLAPRLIRRRSAP
jgi:hypothetical protein